MSERDKLFDEIVATGRLIVENKGKPEQQRHYINELRKLIEMLDIVNQNAALQDEGGNLQGGKKKYIKEVGGVK
jgi:hypothetical protein